MFFSFYTLLNQHIPRQHIPVGSDFKPDLPGVAMISQKNEGQAAKMVAVNVRDHDYVDIVDRQFILLQTDKRRCPQSSSRPAARVRIK